VEITVVSLLLALGFIILCMMWVEVSDRVKTRRKKLQRERVEAHLDGKPEHPNNKFDPNKDAQEVEFQTRIRELEERKKRIENEFRGEILPIQKGIQELDAIMDEMEKIIAATTSSEC